MTKRKGRPRGARTADRLRSDVVASRCPRCQSTERTPYRHVRTLAQQGLAPDGRPYTNILLDATACQNCGQARIDRRYECRT
jgi:predicted RNA-binding Zn-ribbon protein involved in translation (DUF1610 family)